MKTSLLPGQSSLPTPNSTVSFWHSQPSKILLGHRTTESLPAEADVVIIGSGLSGTSAALFLREDEEGKNLKIVMLEAREACWGATGRNGGHCQPFIYGSPPSVSSFEMRNYLFLKSFVATHSIPCDWRTLQVAHAYMEPAMFAHALSEYNKLLESNPSLSDLVSVITPDSKSPSLKELRIPNASGAFLQKHAASMWPYKLVTWMLEHLLSLNDSQKTASIPAFNLQTNTPVTQIQKSANGSWTITTPRGTITTKQVLLTTNAYTSHLLPHFRDLIVPVRGEMSSLLPPPSMVPGSPNNPPLEYSYGFIGNGRQNRHQDDYLIQRPSSTSSPLPDSHCTGGELMFGGGRSYARNAGLGVSDDSEIDEPAAEYLRREITKIVDIKSEQQELKASFEWSGIMGYSRDERPWVGEVSEVLDLGGGKGIFVSAGFTGHGMPNTVLCGKAVVELMLGREEVDLPEGYRLNKGRVEEARALDEVSVTDARG